VTSGCCAGRLEGCSPPEQVVDHYVCGLFKLSEPFIYVAALEMRPKTGDGDVDGREPGLFESRHRFPELLDATRTVALPYHEGSGLGSSDKPVDRIFQHCRGTVIVFGARKRPSDALFPVQRLTTSCS
jgi:hypothetical protein